MSTLDPEELAEREDGTRFVHGGQEPDPASGAVVPPIVNSSTFHQDELEGHPDYEYSRTGNPTRAAFEEQIAVAEGGDHGYAFASGSAATNTVLNLLEQGDHVVSGEDLYGGTYRLFEQAWKKLGVEFTYVDATDTSEVTEAVREETELVWLESPTNPLLRLTDIEEVCEQVPEDVLVALDNTFATPYHQRPLELGCDLVVHSTTKYVGGHSDLVGGAIVVDDEDLGEQIAFYQNAVGAVPSPFDCFLAGRGLKTLEVRMRQHSANAQAVAEFLDAHSRVNRVFYPGLPSHPEHELAKRQMHNGYSGMVSFELEGGVETAKDFATETDLFVLAESLGGIESLLNHPATMTHASIPHEERIERGLTDGLLRLSVGIEDSADLIADLEGAIEQTFS